METSWLVGRRHHGDDGLGAACFPERPPTPDANKGYVVVVRLFALLVCCLLSALAEGGGPAASAAPAKPNILLIIADDLGWQDVGWHGGIYQTPTLDRLVREGVELDRHYVQPVCTPTRTALLSGRWTSRFGPQALSPSNLRVYAPGTTTLASALKQAGYSTSMAGKWHLGSKPEWGPNHYGFDHSYGSLNGAVDPWTHQYRQGPYLDTWHRDERIFQESGNATELVAEEAKRRIREATSPWFLYVPLHAVHLPVDAPEKYKELYRDKTFGETPERAEAMRRMGAFISQMDAKVGEFVQVLEETKQRERTLIVFSSDNGGLAGGKNPYVGTVPDSPVLSSNRPLRGYKNQLYEGGIRVSAFANWPGQLSPRKVEETLHAVDWMPTLTRLAGWTPPAEVRFDGEDLWPLLTGETTALPSRAIYIPHPGGRVMIREGWKLITYNDQRKPQLFQVRRDPGETRNLAEREPGKLAELQAVLSELKRADVTELPADLVGEED